MVDASNFKFDKKFDSIFSNAALHWVKDYNNDLKCMYEHLNPVAEIVVEFGGKRNVQTFVNQLRSALRKKGHGKQSDLDLWYFPSTGEYSSELEAAGFRDVYAEHFDRLTELADENSRIKDWVSTFADEFFTGVADNPMEEIKMEIQERM